jgi:hypothetical protein
MYDPKNELIFHISYSPKCLSKSGRGPLKTLTYYLPMGQDRLKHKFY